MRDDKSPSARFRHAAFLDLLADAAHGYSRSKRESQPYDVSRAARASIIASCLSIECFANCLLEAVEMQPQLGNEIDKMAALAKVDLLLSLKGIETLDRGAAVVQKVSELVRIRNDYVHPKVIIAPADIRPFEESDSHFVVPFNVTTTFWPALKIPKQSLVWDSEAAGNALKAIASFYALVLIDKLKVSDEELARFLLSRFEFAHFLMPAVYDEYIQELDALRKDDIDFSFLKL